MSRDRDELITALRDNGNSFPVMYLLAPYIERAGLCEFLPDHVKRAMLLVAAKAGDRRRRGSYARRLPRGGDLAPTYETLKWMIDSGADWDGPSAGRDEYDAAIDLAAAHIAARFPDSVLLTKIAELIFRRNRRGMYIHDLVWGFFQAADIRALSAAARYILSEDPVDSSLACRILGIEEPGTREERAETYKRFTEWLTESGGYLSLTGEHFNAASAPRPLARTDAEFESNAEREISAEGVVV
jgi:hypothetical protein